MFGFTVDDRCQDCGQDQAQCRVLTVHVFDWDTNTQVDNTEADFGPAPSQVVSLDHLEENVEVLGGYDESDTSEDVEERTRQNIRAAAAGVGAYKSDPVDHQV